MKSNHLFNNSNIENCQFYIDLNQFSKLRFYLQIIKKNILTKKDFSNIIQSRELMIKNSLFQSILKCYRSREQKNRL